MSFGIYVHIPFCSRRCDYCDFATWVDKEDLIEEYFSTILRQIDFQWDHFAIQTGIKVDSIFFGGGTPNLVEEKFLIQIIDRISSKANVSEETEITVECNPDHVTKLQMESYFQGGVNRISLGVQSYNNNVLKFLGREHDKDQVIKARETVFEAGISNVSADLIYGSSVESTQDWVNSLEATIDLNLDHISCYALGIESGTPLGRSVATGEKQDTDEEDLARKYEIADEILNENGFSWYEISNWAKPGKNSVHNWGYWRGADVMPLGCAAHGVIDKGRFSTPRNIDCYLEKLSPKRNLKELNCEYLIDQNKVETIDIDEELFALQLRTSQGVLWPFEVSPKLQMLIDEGFMVLNPSTKVLSFTLKGRLLAHPLTVELFQERKKLDVDVEWSDA